MIEDLDAFMAACEAASKHLPGAGSGDGVEMFRPDAEDEATLDRIWDQIGAERRERLAREQENTPGHPGTDVG